MTAPRLPDRDSAQVDALVADRYLDALLAAGDRRADDAPADARLDPELRDAARALRRALVRVHPSFRFEERLSSRLAELAAAQAQPATVAAARGGIVPFPRSGLADPDLDAILRGEVDPSAPDPLDPLDRAPADRRPLLVTGALTSAAISLAGVVWVAWRATRPASRAGVMGRAVREAHARGGDAIAGIGGPA